MRKKKLSQLLLLRWLNLYGKYHPVHEALEFEMGRMKSHNDVLRCCMATSMESNRIGYADKVALVVNPKAVRRIFNKDVYSRAIGHKGSLTVEKNSGGNTTYSECWVKATKDCYTGVVVINWSNCTAQFRKDLAKAVLNKTPWSELLDLASGKIIDLKKWSGV